MSASWVVSLWASWPPPPGKQASAAETQTRSPTELPPAAGTAALFSDVSMKLHHQSVASAASATTDGQGRTDERVRGCRARPQACGLRSTRRRGARRQACGCGCWEADAAARRQREAIGERARRGRLAVRPLSLERWRARSLSLDLRTIPPLTHAADMT